jgi:hypothetical protein
MPKIATYETSLAAGVELGLLHTPMKLAHVLRSFASSLAPEAILPHAVDLLPKVLDYADRLQLKRVRIAARCEVNEATVSRWASGRVRPNAIVAREAISAVRDLAFEKAHEYELENQALLSICRVNSI